MKKTVCVITAVITAVTMIISVIPLSAAFNMVAGDVNGDGEINNKDVVALFRALSSEDDQTPAEVLDFNGDGNADNKDVVVLFRAVSALSYKCEHEYESEIIREATGEQDGEIVYICRYCGKSYKEVIPKAGNDLGEGDIQ